MTEMRLTRYDLEKITRLLDRLSGVNDFNLITKTNAIGSTLDIQFQYKIADLEATVTLPVTGVECW